MESGHGISVPSIFGKNQNFRTVIYLLVRPKSMTFLSMMNVVAVVSNVNVNKFSEKIKSY
jgi:hypothetical protein